MPYKWPADTDHALWELDVLDSDGRLADPRCTSATIGTDEVLVQRRVIAIIDMAPETEVLAE